MTPTAGRESWHGVRMTSMKLRQPAFKPPPDLEIGPPVLNPSVRLLWRGLDAIQLELGQRAVVVDGVDADIVRRLLGARTTAPPPSAESAIGRTIAALTAAGFMCTGAESGQTRPAPRLAADLAALRIRHGHRAADVLAARSDAAVVVHGTGRVASAVGALLGAAGVGRVSFHDRGEILLRAAVPGGISPADEGRPFRDAVAEAVQRAAPEVDTAPLPAGVRPALVVIANGAPIEEELNDSLHARACAHLVTQSGGEHMTVGPLVLPGLTSCLRCADLHRIDRDPAWSALAVQLAAPTKRPAPSDVAVASLAASVTALQALAFIDGDEPATLSGTLELQLPNWRIRRRSWPARADCACGACTADPPG